MWSKSGSVLCREENGKMIATKVNGKYWMYWGESNIYMATSDNLIDWNPVLETDADKMVIDEMRNYTVAFKILFSTREGKFDSELVEPGPPALLTENGFVFIYNSKNSPEFGDKTWRKVRMLPDKFFPIKMIRQKCWIDWIIISSHPISLLK